METRDLVNKVISILDQYDFDDDVLADIVSEVYTILEGTTDPYLNGILAELDEIAINASEDNWFDLGNQLQELMDNLVEGNIPCIVLDKSYVLKKTFKALRENPSMRRQIDDIVKGS